MHSLRQRGFLGGFFVAIFFLAPGWMPAQELIVGVNVVNPMRASVADQNILLSQLWSSAWKLRKRSVNQ